VTWRPGLVDLAAERLGGRAVAANDEFFAPKGNLLKPGRGVFIEGKYTTRGKWMDGWETRRRREPGHDWCVVRLAAPGVVRAVTVDTNHFRGNHPESCSLETVAIAGAPTPRRLAAESDWVEVLPRSLLKGHTENDFAVAKERRATHVRLNIYPDGGVARLRVWGVPQPDWDRLERRGAALDLVAAQLGGAPLACSDEFFSEPINLLMPGRGRDMGDGWETRRRRGPGNDWVVVRMAHRGLIERILVDTHHFKGNYPESCSLEGCDATALEPDAVPPANVEWRELLPRTTLQAHRQHSLRPDAQVPVTHVRFKIYPDGGVSRLRLFGRPVGAEWR
jgi:allantoicase